MEGRAGGRSSSMKKPPSTEGTSDMLCFAEDLPVLAGAYHEVPSNASPTYFTDSFFDAGLGNLVLGGQ